MAQNGVHRPAGACRSQALRPSRPVDQPARFSQPSRRFAWQICETLDSAGRTCRFATAKRCVRWGRHLWPGSRAIGSDVPRGMPVANRLCPDENLLRQNASS
ncbi:hypothetical protein FFR93_24530 [Rhizobium sp. MHM7A]|nr:hypothetical protein FFR93_24530 [Rhizobium sp. MHM7A]